MSVYFIQAGDGGLIKIGHARSVTQRLAALQTGSSKTLRVLHEMRGGALEEQGLHGALRRHRIQGEWFAPHPEVLNCIARLKGEKPKELAALDAADMASMPRKFFAFVIRRVLEGDDQEAVAAAGLLFKLYLEDEILQQQAGARSSSHR